MSLEAKLNELLPRLQDGHYKVRDEAAAAILAADPGAAILAPLLLVPLEGGGDARMEAANALSVLVRYAFDHTGADTPLLAALRERGIPSLLACTKDASWYVRSKIVDVLGLLKPEDPAVLEALIAALGDERDRVKESACLALAAYKAAAAPAVPALIPLLRSAVDEYACTALRAIGPAAAAAVPVLRQRAKRADPSGRDHAEQALRAIEGPKPAPAKKKKTSAVSEEPSFLGAVSVLELSGQKPQCITLSPDRETFASAVEGRISVRKLADGAEIASFQQGEETIRALVHSPDGHLIVSTGDDKHLRIHRVDDRSLVASLPARVHVTLTFLPIRPDFSHDGRTLAFCAPEAICFWGETGALRRASVPLAIDGICFSAEGEQILAWSPDGAALVDVASGAKLATYPAMGRRESPMLIQDARGRFLLLSASSTRKQIFIDDATSGERLQTIATSASNMGTYALSPDRRFFAATGAGKVQLFCIEDGRELGAASVRKGTISDIVIRSDGALLGATNRLTGILLWPLTPSA